MVDRYDGLYESFRWDVPERYNIARGCCGRWAEDRARFALYWEAESGAATAHTFWDLQREANRLSNALAQLGVQRGDKVALVLPQRRETAVAHIAIYQMGAVAVPLSFLFGPDALEYRLAHSETPLGLVYAQSLPNLAPARNKPSRIGPATGVHGRARAGVSPDQEPAPAG